MHDLSRLGEWASLPFFGEDLPRIEAQLAKTSEEILPPPDLRFRAFEDTGPDRVRVVILGQDPYPTKGHANGLAFSVASGTRLPRSLVHIFQEIESDLGTPRDKGDLSDWAVQGVLLLNTALTVPEGKAGAHASLGWDRLTRQALDRLGDRPRALILWGRAAQAYRRGLKDPGHLVVESAHPSPLSARRGFFGSAPFSKVNTWLRDRGDTPIAWA
ncbi:MAG: uracil-DNA glycosylase [Pseudomonadota bacterium]